MYLVKYIAIKGLKGRAVEGNSWDSHIFIHLIEVIYISVRVIRNCVESEVVRGDNVVERVQLINHPRGGLMKWTGSVMGGVKERDRKRELVISLTLSPGWKKKWLTSF
jgi:hypothetical protein